MAEEKKKYGLIFKKKQNLIRTIDTSLAKVFVDEDESNEILKPREIITNYGSSMSNKLSKTELDKAMNEDPSVCQYDELYDSMEKNKQMADPRRSESTRKPKYVEDLLKAAAFRKRERARRMDRKIQKERQEEGDGFDDNESFVTENYRIKLEEREAEEKDLIVQYKDDDSQSVSKQGNMTQFYRQYLLTQHDSRSINTNPTDAKLPTVPPQPDDMDKTPVLSDLSGNEKDLPEKNNNDTPIYKVIREENTDSVETKPVKERHYGISPRKNSQKLVLSPKKEQDNSDSLDLNKDKVVINSSKIFIPLKNWKVYDRRNTDTTIEEARQRYFQRKKTDHLSKYIVVEKE